MKVKHDYAPKEYNLMPSWRDVWFILKEPVYAASGAFLFVAILVFAYSIEVVI